MMNERFSAYLDGEATPEEAEAVWSELNRDPALRTVWGRQHWLRAMLRDVDASATYDPGFAARVTGALDGGSEEYPRVMHAMPRRRWRTTASLAAAASIVGAVLLTTDPLDNGGEETAPAVVAETAAEADTVASTADTRPTATVAEASRAADHWSVSDPDVEDQLNGYLLEHNGLARSYGMSGATPSFLRVATYGQDANR